MMPYLFERNISQKSRRTTAMLASIIISVIIIEHNFIYKFILQYIIGLDSQAIHRVTQDLHKKQDNSPTAQLRQNQYIITKLKPKRLVPINNERNANQYKSTKDYQLTEEEKNVYGERTLQGYEKISLLGRGGFALVWLAKKGQEKIALKQIAKPSNNQESRFNFINCPNIIQIMNIEQTNRDIWIVQELGGQTLSKALYQMKGEFYKGERVYQINETQYLKDLIQEPQTLQQLLQGILIGIKTINENNVTHFDIKPDNILIENNVPKIIDFGSAFQFNDKTSFGMITPEYMSPEVLDILHNWHKYQNQYDSQIEALIKKYGEPKCDVWSFGIIILDILLGVPNWLSYKGKVVRNGKVIIRSGLFAVKGRDMDKIMVKQNQLQIDQIVWNNCNFQRQTKKNQLLDLLKKSLNFDPIHRLSASDLLKHEFFWQ